MKRRTTLILTILGGALLSACGGTIRIARINADPSRFQNRDVRVAGQVTNSFGALGTGGYQIDDGSGKIFVVSTGTGVPNKGSRVTVSGTVVNGATIMGTAYGTTIREHNHKVQ
jgi:hypothetical protein